MKHQSKVDLGSLYLTQQYHILINNNS